MKSKFFNCLFICLLTVLISACAESSDEEAGDQTNDSLDYSTPTILSHEFNLNSKELAIEFSSHMRGGIVPLGDYSSPFYHWLDDMNLRLSFGSWGEGSTLTLSNFKSTGGTSNIREQIFIFPASTVPYIVSHMFEPDSKKLTVVFSEDMQNTSSIVGSFTESYSIWIDTKTFEVSFSTWEEGNTITLVQSAFKDLSGDTIPYAQQFTLPFQ